jgi:Ca2+/H+ antiporter, TMEM165/GDT1 family
MIPDILVPFFTVALAEIGDRTQLLVLALATKTRHHRSLLLAAMAAFALSVGLAVFFGNAIAALVPTQWIRWVAGIVFILFGVQALRNHEEEKAAIPSRSFISTFTLILLSEMGDKSQIATLLFATRLDAAGVFLGAFGALAVLAVVSIFVGKALATRLSPKTIHYLSGAAFLLAGIGFLVF